jgi:hypothetical protein
MGSTIFVNASDRDDDHRSPAISPLDDGGFIIVWDANDNDAIQGLRYDSAGIQVGDVFTIAKDKPLGFIVEPDVTLLGDGRVAVA